jgi:hypothetical protein
MAKDFLNFHRKRYNHKEIRGVGDWRIAPLWRYENSYKVWAVLDRFKSSTKIPTAYSGLKSKNEEMNIFNILTQSKPYVK